MHERYEKDVSAMEVPTTPSLNIMKNLIIVYVMEGNDTI
jgi:hypothetical protein